jgi:hypothetical protein
MNSIKEQRNAKHAHTGGWNLVSLFAPGAGAQRLDWQVFAEPFVTAAHAQDIDWQKVDEVLGRKPAVTADVHRYGFPRTDLTVTLDGVTIKPALALGGWIAFKPAHGGVMAMGDLVLLEPEINPVMLKMIASGLEIAAYGFVLRVPTPGAIILSSLGLPVTSDSDVFGAAAILLTGLVRLLRRLPRLNRSGLGLNWRHAPFGDQESECRNQQQSPYSKNPLGLLHHRNTHPTPGSGLCSEIADLFCCRSASNGISQAEGRELRADHRSCRCASASVCSRSSFLERISADLTFNATSARPMAH